MVKGGKMKITRKKVVIAGFFAVLMLMMPFVGAVTENKAVENLQSGELLGVSGQLQMYQIDDEPGLVKMLYVLGDQALQLVLLEIIDRYGLENIESGKIVLNQKEINSIVQTVVENAEISPENMETMAGENIGGNGGITTIKTDGKKIDNAVGFTSGEISGDIQYINDYQPLKGGRGIWRTILNFIIGGFRSVIDLISQADSPRAGYLNGIADFYVNQNLLLDQIRYNLSPNVTWVEVIEETLGWLGYNFSVHDYIFGTLQIKLRDLVENRTWIIPGLGIRRAFYEKFILPLILTILTEVMQSIYDGLNQKVEWGKGPLNKLKDRFGKFMDAIKLPPGKERRRGILGNFTRLIGAAFRLSIASVAYLLYMNETQIEEYIKGIYNSVNDYVLAWDNFLSWMSEEPWLDPVTIQGNVTGLDVDKLGGIKVYSEHSDNQVYTNSDGTFEGLIYNSTLDDSYFICGLHKCVTTALDEDTGTTVTVGALNEDGNITAWILNRILVGAFSGGTINLTINFSVHNNNYLQSKNTVMTPQQQKLKIITTILKRTQYK